MQIVIWSPSKYGKRGDIVDVPDDVASDLLGRGMANNVPAIPKKPNGPVGGTMLPQPDIEELQRKHAEESKKPKHKKP